jgi:hypothetical protein
MGWNGTRRRLFPRRATLLFSVTFYLWYLEKEPPLHLYIRKVEQAISTTNLKYLLSIPQSMYWLCFNAIYQKLEMPIVLCLLHNLELMYIVPPTSSNLSLHYSVNIRFANNSIVPIIAQPEDIRNLSLRQYSNRISLLRMQRKKR